jgi:triosephosphate isomerase
MSRSTRPAVRPFIGGNWKMNLRLASAVELAETLHADLSGDGEGAALDARIDVAVFPPATYLMAVGRAMGHGPPALGAQDLSPHEDGAYTGQVSAGMLDDLNARWVLVGHSERRHGLAEPPETIRAKLRRALEADLEVVLCVGETLEERESGDAEATIVEQLRSGLEGLETLEAFPPERIVLAYEPVWAIGTGRTAHPDDAEEAHRWIRRTLGELYDRGLAAATRVVYGGSVTASNAAELFSRPEIDGGLVGGASLKAESFAAICRAAESRLGTSA